VKKRQPQKTAASVARGHTRELAKRGIKLDKQRRPRKDGRPITIAKLERAVSAIKRSRARPNRIKPQAKKKSVTKPQTKPVTKPQTKPKISERDSFILESLERNHLAPEVRRKYIRSLSPIAKKSLERQEKPAPKTLKPKPIRQDKGKKTKLTERDRFILASWGDFPEDIRKEYFKKLSPAAKLRIEKRERNQIKAEEKAEKKRLALEEARSLLPVARRLREDLEKAMGPKTWEAIRREVLFDTSRTKAIVIQKGSDVKPAAEEASKTTPTIDGGPAANRFYAVIAAVTQYPPEAHYGQRPLNPDEGLTIFYFTTKTVNTKNELASAIVEAIEKMRAQLPGDAPMAIVGVYIRTKTVEEKAE
jgi:hypothetical protein